MIQQISFAYLAAAVALATTLSGCTDCEEAETTTDVRIPGSWCTVGSCERWRTGPCEETCAAFLDASGVVEITGCEPPRAGEDSHFLLVECRYVRQTCTTSPRLMSGRPQARHVARGPMSGDDALGRFFAEAAEAEESSVHAFRELARELTRRGGPRELVERCVDAARDEQRHRRAMSELARARGAEPSRAVPTPSSWTSLRALAIENVVAGRVEELWAAALTVHGALSAADASVRMALSPIARDEARHAVLSADLESYLRGHLDAADVDAVDAAREAAIARLRQEVRIAEDGHPVVRAGILPGRRVRLRLFEAIFGSDPRSVRCAA